ncbi:hypothetical protein HCN51_39475 [Nonomuraea sp. FMUSA5-5]|uniref:Uncharacterized protein n=1 Tax=Nonomuraea composti TaxID=2720023 RepID=A0ABX1BCE0_9ACTN|nr:hypothetical protein [Nonomuraea sp. FMUSA5-5]NJP95453.1 hypothetical protein [Nonomuraea sp. FMUSA5-5]
MAVIVQDRNRWRIGAKGLSVVASAVMVVVMLNAYNQNEVLLSMWTASWETALIWSR